MIIISKTLLDGMILSGIASLFLITVLYVNPRLLMHGYPEEIQSQAPSKTALEKRQSLIIGLLFLILLVALPIASTLTLKRQIGETVSFLQLFAHAFGILFIFNIVDLLLLDWLLFCTITPKFIVIPGTEGLAAYKEYRHHFRAFMKGTVVSIVAGVVIAALLFLL